MATAGEELHKQSLADPSKFWGEAAKAIDWMGSDGAVVEYRAEFTRWFPNRYLNFCFNAVDRHILAGRGEQNAIIYDSPVTSTVRKLTYNKLFEEVSKFATVLKANGVKRGDTVLIYMPNLPETAIAMLACNRIGAVHTVVFGGFAPAEIATRIKDSKPKLILYASCGIDGNKTLAYQPLVNAALELSADTHRVSKCIVLQRSQLQAEIAPGRDVDWATAVASAPAVNASTLSTQPAEAQVVPCEAMQATDPLYILYTSGTTGAPKGVVRDTGGYAVALKWSLTNIYNMKPGEVYWAASDVGWVVGHSYMIYGPLLQGCTTVIYEGKPVGTPDAGAFWRVIQDYKVKTLFTAPTAIRAIKKADHHNELLKKYDVKSLQAIFLAGEHADPDTVKWLENSVHCGVLDHWWQTETGWPICSNLIGVDGFLPVKYGSTFRPCPGFDLQALDENRKPVPAGTLGNLAIKLPLPPGSLLTLCGNDKRFSESYMKTIPGFYDTGDCGIVDDDGYVHVMSRTDDVINVAGHRLSTGQMEEILSEHPDIAEVAVVGVKDTLKGQIPLGLFVLYEDSTTSPDDVISQAVALVRERIGAVACFKDAVIVQRLPKTRSGKVVRNTIRAIANGTPYNIPATLEDPQALVEITAVIKQKAGTL